MVTINEWWSIAQIAGAGATVVLGPMCYVLWKQHISDTEYIRESDKNTLKVLGNLTNHLNQGDLGNKLVLKEIEKSTKLILNKLKTQSDL